MATAINPLVNIYDLEQTDLKNIFLDQTALTEIREEAAMLHGLREEGLLLPGDDEIDEFSRPFWPTIERDGPY